MGSLLLRLWKRVRICEYSWELKFPMQVLIDHHTSCLVFCAGYLVSAPGPSPVVVDCRYVVVGSSGRIVC
jgi:hypothetical protein